MRYTLLIFIFWFSRFSAQPGAPDLRCLEVMNNGSVKLTWITPSDPSNLFFSYDIYFSALKNGPYSIVSSGLNSITTTTFVHTTTVTLVQSGYYFMVTNYGASGSSSSGHSDTLNTIFLTSNSNFVRGTQDISYTTIHKPKLPSTASTFTLNKEYPLGNWFVLSISSATVYPDTIDICKAKMGYQAMLSDASGCTSISNLLVGEYIDIKRPEEPYVDSISVLPNGNTIVAWNVPVDRDIKKYNIQYAVGNSPHQLIDSIMGRNNTSYTYTTPTANSNAIGVFVQAVDTCGNGSTVNYQIHSMYLQEDYDYCSYRTTLMWTPYAWSSIKGVPVETTGKYRIYYSVNGGPFTQIGETTDTSFVHSNVDGGKNVCYYVRVFNQKNTITASSNRNCFFSGQTVAARYVYIKTATVLDKTSAEIRIYLDNSRSSKGISVKRSLDGTNFATVGFLPYTGGSQYSLVDHTIDAAAHSYYYQAFTVDSCGNSRLASNTAKTILLKVHEDSEQMFIKQLSWSPYEGFLGGVSGYNVYRIVDGNMSQALVGSTDALTTTYTDDVENAGTTGSSIIYVVEAVEGISNPYGIMESSDSNPVPVYVDENIYVPNAFAPNGHNTTWKPVTNFVDKNEYHVRVFNRWGKIVFETNDLATAWDGAGCPSDVYVYLIDYKNSRGEYLQVKGNIMLLR